METNPWLKKVEDHLAETHHAHKNSEWEQIGQGMWWCATFRVKEPNCLKMVVIHPFSKLVQIFDGIEELKL